MADERPGVSTPATEIEVRIAGLQRALAEAGADAALVLQNADLYYYAGTVQQSYLYVPAEGDATLAVRRVFERARRESPLQHIEQLSSVRALPGLVADRHGSVRRLGLELDVLPVARLNWLLQLFPGAEPVDISPAIVAQRAVKSAYEVELQRASAAIADGVCARIPGILRPGLTDAAFAGLVEAEARALGHEGFIRMRGFNQEMFYGHLLVGANGDVASYLDTPLAGPGMSPSIAQGVSMRRIAEGEPVVFDFVAVRHGYQTDFTRMFSLGRLPDALRRAYAVALEAQAAVVERARPGVSCGELYEAALAVARAAGLEDCFMGNGATRVRFVGHGIGLELDEPPVLAQTDRELAEGMVFALEPKFVLPGLGAVGIENTWVVRADGLECLHRSSEELRELPVGASRGRP